MAKEVKVPVRVEGSEKAQSELKSTGQAVKGVGAAGAQAAKGTGQATVATKAHTAAHGKAQPAIKGTAKAVNQFDDSAKTAMTGILGQFNPMLASLGNIAVDVAKGISKMTLALGGMVAAGVAISGLVWLFRTMRAGAQAAEEALEKATKAREKFAQKQQEPAQRIAADLQQAGAYSVANFEKAYLAYIDIMNEGVEKTKAAALATPTMLAGLKPWQAARVAAAPVEPETKEQARKAFEELQAKQKTRVEVAAAAERAKESPAGRAAIAEAALAYRELGKQPRFLEKVTGISHDAILLAKAIELGLADTETSIEQVDELLKKYGELQRERGRLARPRPGVHVAPGVAVGAGGIGPLSARRITQVDKEIEALQPLLDLSETLKQAGIADTTGKVRDIARPESLPSFSPEGFSPETRQVTVNISNNQTTINQGTVLDAQGVLVRPEAITPEIIERGAGMP